MKTKALLAIGLCLFSACGKKARTDSQIEAAALRPRMAEQKAARQRVEETARDYLVAVNEAAMARRGLGVQRRLIETSSRLPLGTPSWMDTRDEECKAAETAARATEAKEAFGTALAAYRQAAIPNTPELPDYQGRISAHEAELTACLKQLEGESDSGDRLYALVAQHLDEVLKER